MLYEGELMPYSSTQWGTAKVLLLFSAVLFIKLEQLLILETPIALSGLDETGWCVQCYSLGKERWKDGWTQTLHLISLLFKRARLKGSLWNRDTNLGGSLLVQYPDPSTTLLFLFSEYWSIPCRTAQPFQEGMRMPPLSPSAVSATSEPACSWCGFQSPQILLRRGTCLLPLKKGFNQKLSTISSTAPAFVWHLIY